MTVACGVGGEQVAVGRADKGEARYSGTGDRPPEHIMHSSWLSDGEQGVGPLLGSVGDLKMTGLRAGEG